ncbi:S24 family peptidase [Defluviicoccus vanus]|uniref:Helix-turn-helix transcriptional regulator n=1 Tax=Defluviicoccus vanus TaxID=111831 RepID=A0A7H1N1S0_9PROT|nr:helix-turn-helix transcriptional regulator [Defluviicoccus vanus]QNT69656.1 helix-turn-helix transcriptional regulator [Defluviicoccus vanus]
MSRHQDIWRAIDRLAERHGLTPSGLARKAGLDPTTFNKSKRITRDERARWPSTESIEKILDATGATWGEFVSFMNEGTFKNIPLIGFAQAGAAGFFDDAGYPAGAGWEDIPFPDIGDPHAYALEISGDSMEPVYRDGDVVIVCPQAPLRRGDRVIVKTREGEIMAKILKRKTSNKYELRSLNPEHPDRWLTTEEVEWVARILWATQ